MWLSKPPQEPEKLTGKFEIMAIFIVFARKKQISNVTFFLHKSLSSNNMLISRPNLRIKFFFVKQAVTQKQGN